MNEIDSKELGQTVRLSREKQGLSQKELAGRIGISRSMVSKFEEGKRNLSQEKLDFLLDYLDEFEKTPVNRVIVDYVTIHCFP